MKIEYETIQRDQLDDSIRDIFAAMLRKQGKVKGELATKADRCKLICVARIDGNVVAIGGIKKKTASDFDYDKAGIPDLAKEFEWELGYLYTDSGHGGRGLASTIVRLLIDAYGKGSLMASTEIAANPAMVRILEKQGFRLFGKPWKSSIHDNHLGLFLKFE
ncbi:MAG: GNAT family N-acetyltransferase [Sulfuritalea sp.]|nr:GNAT family N-acetyltransferase [Sulfuritalea sp.]